MQKMVWIKVHPLNLRIKSKNDAVALQKPQFSIVLELKFWHIAQSTTSHRTGIITLFILPVSLQIIASFYQRLYTPAQKKTTKWLQSCIDFLIEKNCRITGMSFNPPTNDMAQRTHAGEKKTWKKKSIYWVGPRNWTQTHTSTKIQNTKKRKIIFHSTCLTKVDYAWTR